MARLSQLDADAGGALRVVTFYDTLMRRRVDVSALLRASAGLAECVVGMRLEGSGQVIRMGPDGSAAPDPTSQASTTAPVTLDDEEIGAVWLERPGPGAALDELLLDRLALAVAAVVERYGPAQTTMADPALVELIVSADTDGPARDRALRLLGFAPERPVVVVATCARMPLDKVGAVICDGRNVKAAQLADVGVLVAEHIDCERFPSVVRAGIGTADVPNRSWRQARTALRFTTGRRPVLRYDDLGALAVLADIPRSVVRDNADVIALQKIAGTADGSDALKTLDAYCESGSLRRAADRLHLHHSSVARRLEHLSAKLGFDLTEPGGLVRASMALTMLRLQDD